MTIETANRISVDELGLPTRAARCLHNANLDTLYQVAQKSDMDLLRYRNFGKKSMMEIKAKISEMGLHMGMRECEWEGPERGMEPDPRLELKSRHERRYKHIPDEDLSKLYSDCCRTLPKRLRDTIDLMGWIMSEICFRDTERALEKTIAEINEVHDRDMTAANKRIKKLETRLQNLKAKAEGV